MGVRRNATSTLFLLIYNCSPGQLPGSLLEEVVLFTVNQLGPELGHLVLHFPHFRVESFTDVGELGIDDTEVSHLNRNIPIGHG